MFPVSPVSPIFPVAKNETTESRGTRVEGNSPEDEGMNPFCSTSGPPCVAAKGWRRHSAAAARLSIFDLRFSILGALFLGIILAGPTGCAHQQTRMQSPEENDKDKLAEIKTVRDVASFANTDAVVVSGVGLVVGLEGTGGDPPPGGYREMLVNDLRKRGVENIKEVLASPNNAMVLVQARIPAGAHKGDPMDVDVIIPPGSKATSLRGGYLKDCPLYNFENTKDLNPNFAGPNRALQGHAVAHAEGPILAGKSKEGDDSGARLGQIWAGGRSKIERPFYLVLNEGHQYARMAKIVSDRINESFHGPFRGGLDSMAVPQTKAVIALRAPQQYRLNLPRFLRVVGAIPLGEAVDGLHVENLARPANSRSVAVGVGSPYWKLLEDQLLDPAHTLTAALHLEAQGTTALGVLKTGLSSEHVLVRFASAEALAYLGDRSGAEVLAQLVERQPALRAYCLTAMASLDENVCHVKLRELLSSRSAETRYGAFRALRALREDGQDVQGELLNDSYWVHRGVGDGPPLVHVSTTKRAEIVLFGEEPTLLPPFSFLCGEFTVTAGPEDVRCTIRRLSTQHTSRPEQCSLKLADVLHTLADMGGTYPEAVELVNQAGTYNGLSCPVAFDALPQAPSVQALAKKGAEDPDFFGTDKEILNAHEDLGATPTLFEKPAAPRSRLTAEREDNTSPPAPQDKNGKKVRGQNAGE